MSPTVRAIAERDRPDWLRMRDALWPGSLVDHDAETRRHFAMRAPTPVVFVAEQDGATVGFLELDFASTRPVARRLPCPSSKVGSSMRRTGDAALDAR